VLAAAEAIYRCSQLTDQRPEPASASPAAARFLLWLRRFSADILKKGQTINDEEDAQLEASWASYRCSATEIERGNRAVKLASSGTASGEVRGRGRAGCAGHPQAGLRSGRGARFFRPTLIV
jgi:hypothetical protein